MAREDQLAQYKQWEIRVRDFRASGTKAIAWCSEQKVKTHQLKYWMKQNEKSKHPPQSPEATEKFPLIETSLRSRCVL